MLIKNDHINRMELCLCSFDLSITTNANVGPNWEICIHGPTKKFKSMINIILEDQTHGMETSRST